MIEVRDAGTLILGGHIIARHRCIQPSRPSAAAFTPLAGFAVAGHLYCDAWQPSSV